MCYCMHTGAVACLLFRHHCNDKIKDVLRRLDSDVLVGTLSYSDPATGGHFWCEYRLISATSLSSLDLSVHVCTENDQL